jgi:hypothetical protein
MNEPVSIYNPKTNQVEELKEPTKAEVTAWTREGDKVDENDDKAVCKLVGNECYVKAGLYGTFYDPWGPDEHKLSQTLKGYSRKVYEYVKVSRNVWELYTRFIQTRNGSYLINAQRMFGNGE